MLAAFYVFAYLFLLLLFFRKKLKKKNMSVIPPKKVPANSEFGPSDLTGPHREVVRFEGPSEFFVFVHLNRFHIVLPPNGLASPSYRWYMLATIW